MARPIPSRRRVRAARPDGPLGATAIAPPGPTRTCVGCRRRAPALELVRVVGTDDGGLAVGRHLPGRGAWVCPDAACAGLAARKGTWARALRQSVRPEAAADLVEDIAR